MGFLRILLRSGEELQLARPVLAEELIEAKPRLKKLQQLLIDRNKKNGMKLGDATKAANRELESFMIVALSELGDAFVDGKTAILDRLVTLHEEIQAMYHDVMKGRGEVKLDVEALRGKYKEMSGLFDELGKNAKAVAETAEKPRTKAAAKGIAIEPTPLPAGTTFAEAGTRLDSMKGRKGWGALLDAVKRKIGMKANLRAGTVEFVVENGVLKVKSTTKGGKVSLFKEFDTLTEPYKSKPLSTRVIQAHHGCQNALMKKFFGAFGYKGEEAPTIWLRDSTGDSPHGVITHSMQNPNEAARIKANPTYAQIRNWAVADLKAAGAPDDAIRNYLQHMDAYFDRAVRPQLEAAGLESLIGDVKKL